MIKIKTLKCPNCQSLKLRSQTLCERSIRIDENGECKFGKKILKEEKFPLEGNRLFCGNCFKTLKFSDGNLHLIL